MKRAALFRCVFWSIIFWLFIGKIDARAEIASENAFEGVVWEKIIEDMLETPYGVVQSLCATEDYFITIENIADGSDEADIVKAYYRNTTDADGNQVQQYSLAKRVALTNYEHANGMAYNPNTKEIAVALYSSDHPENRGCIFLMDSETLEYKNTVQIAADYNILGIGYDTANDRYVIQTNAEGGYSFKILDSQFQIIEDLGSYADTAKGDNFQDLCVSGDYIINFPLTVNMGIGDFIHMYSISQRKMVSDAQIDFRFENVVEDEPESICELEPGMFLAAVNVTYADGYRSICLYKTMVPYNFSADQAGEEGIFDEKKNENTDIIEQAADAVKGKKGSPVKILPRVLKVIFVILAVLALALAVLQHYVKIQRRRKRRLEYARRERARIRSLYENER